MKPLLSLAAALCMYHGMAQQERSSFTLEEAQQYALENAYSVKDKQLEFEKARQTIKETAAQGLPQVTAGFDFTYNAQLAAQPVPAEFFGGPEGSIEFVTFGTQYQNAASLNVNQLLLDGSYFVALQATRVYKDGARLDREISELEIKKDVAQSYYGVLVSEETVDIIRENVASLEKNFKETKALYDNGFVEEQDVDQLELLVSNLTNNLNRAERQKALAIMMLNFNLGRQVNAEITLSSGLSEVLQVEDLLLNNAFSLENNINYRYVEVQAEGAQLSVKNEKMKYLPTLSGFLRHGQSNFQDDLDRVWSTDEYWIPNTAVGFSLQWNILQGLRRPATVQKAKLDLERAQVAQELTKNQLQLQYDQAKSNYEYAYDNFNTQKRNVDLSKKIRNKTRIKYSEGITSSLDLTQAENQYLEAQQNYLSALQNLLNAKEELILAIGK
ncbi:MAG: TolC family protein [Owenweeksia sp.]